MATIKKQVQEEENKKFIFTSKNITEITEQIADGVVVKRYQNPWFKNEVGVRRAGLSFGITPDEFQEYMKCSEDIHYFAERYCQIKREDGSIGPIRLRPYQKEILNLYKFNRVILCASRQSGKCASRQTILDTLEYGKISIGDLYDKYLLKQRKLTLLEKTKLFLYKLLSRLDNKREYKKDKKGTLQRCLDFLDI